MSLSPEQRQTVATWLGAGDSLAQVQRKLRDQFGVSLTYMEVRFLVDDLNLEIKDPPKPKAEPADVTKAPPRPAPERPAEKKGFFDKVKEKFAGREEASQDGADELPADAPDGVVEDELPPPAGGAVTVTVDGVTLLPGAIASGTVAFSDGVTGKWMVDQYGRPGFTEISQPGYRPSQADAQAFMQELSMALQKKGLY